ncbi:hypothetical protein [Spirosoma sp. 209]|uniref:hypothetical protein n=1 Tax=Spirosoma sp. 209 TaxID=1955701 RepID=UPI00098D1CEC|nr:hypothetical protein [Spirosoma sp. 209]
MVLLLPLSINISTNPFIIQKIISNWMKYALPAFFIFIFFIKGEAIGRYLIPISFLLLFFPILKIKYKIIILIFSLFVFLGDLSARSNIIKFSIPLLLSTIYFARFIVNTKLLEFLRVTLLATPLILFGLGVTNVFNIFKMEEYISGSYTTLKRSNGELKEENLIADTRSLIYTEVLSSAIKNNYIWIGRTPARGNDSDAYGAHAFEELKTGKMERFSNEVSILNILTWTGLVGVILYFFVFYKASYLAINRSNNIFLPIMGLYIAFRWAYAWVEDFSQFDLSYFFLWIMIGMCFSQSFREMTDRDIRYWVLGIFNKRYRRSVVKQPEQVTAEIAVAR